MQRIAEYRNGLSRYASEVVVDELRDREMGPKEAARFVKAQVGPGLPFLSIKTDYNPVTKTAVRIHIDSFSIHC